MSGREAQPEVELSPQAMFTVRLHEWMSFFASTTKEEDDARVDEAQEDLNDLWPYVGQQCMFSGKALYPKFEEDDGDFGGKSRPTVGELEQYFGVSVGIKALPTEDEPPKLFFDFYLGTAIDASDPTCPKANEYHAFLETSGQVVPVRSIEEIFDVYTNPERTPDRAAYLTKASDDFVNMLRSTGFRRLTHKRQKTMVANYLRQTEEIGDVRGEAILLDAEYAFSNRLHDGRVQYDFRNLLGKNISGKCHGLDSLETGTLRSKAIRRDMDMINPYAGLCLVIEDMTGQEEAEDPRGEILYVPISGQQLEVVWGSDEIEGVDEEELEEES
ncbi:MAG TPA: hypothetical protein VFL85_03490 [Candidatus Saccharimonadales bacterium]|nr:hypothetical protein [Candidatus Saccharimonadales bacterium]